LSGISLLLAEPTPLSYLINGNLQSNWHQKNTTKISAEKLALLHVDKKPILTNQLKQLNNIVPKSLLAGAKSAALTPLSLEGKLLFTDKASARFYQDLGTFHLEQLAVKVSLCLSNVLIREELIRQRRYGVAFKFCLSIAINLKP
jgi:hypothetical protein